MKFRFILYAVLSILGQVWLGQLTGQGQGGIGMLLFTIMIELDPKYSFTYLFTKREGLEGESEDAKL